MIIALLWAMTNYIHRWQCTRARNSFSGNLFFKFSVLVLCSARMERGTVTPSCVVHVISCPLVPDSHSSLNDIWIARGSGAPSGSAVDTALRTGFSSVWRTPLLRRVGCTTATARQNFIHYTYTATSKQSDCGVCILNIYRYSLYVSC